MSTDRSEPVEQSAPPTPVVEGGDVAMSEDELDAVVQEINATVRRHGLRMAQQVGALVLDRFFGGSPEFFRRHDKGDRQGFRRLTGHPHLRLSASMLQVYVSVSIQLRELDVAVASQLPLDRHRCLLPLDDPAVKNRLALRCLDEDWDVERLRSEVARNRGPTHRGGRRPVPLSEKMLRGVERALRDDRWEELAARGLEQLDAERARDLLQRLDRTTEQLAALRARLQERADSEDP